MIWQHALLLSSPRVVGVEKEWTGDRSTDFLAPTGSPSGLLQTNREARTEAFKVVQPYRRDNHPTRLDIYANFDLDIIGFTDEGNFIAFLFSW